MRYVLVAILLCVGASSNAGTMFDLRALGIESIDEVSSFSLTQDGITATLEAFVAGNTGVLNRTNSGFGINAEDILDPADDDDTDQLDGVDGIESISITFDTEILLESLTVSAFGSGDEGSVTIGSFPLVSLTGTGTTSFTTNNLLTSGDAVVVSYVSGNGFSFDSFQVAASAVVPEPTSALIVLCGSLVPCVTRRRKR